MQPLIHIGYSKCASTFLQRNILPNHAEIAFFGKNLSGVGEKFCPGARELTGSLINLEAFNGLEPTLVHALHNFRQDNQDKTFVWSNELFCETSAPFLLFEQLARLVPDARILVVIRKQTDIIQSMYRYKGYHMQFAPGRFRGRFVSFDDWYNYSKENLLNKGGHKGRDWSADYLRIIDYNRFIEIIESHFSRANILVVPYEQLILDMGMVYDLIGVSRKDFRGSSAENKSNNSFVAHKIADRFGLKKGFGLGLAERLKKNSHFNHEILKEVYELYKTGNAALSKRYSLDLCDYGYC